MVTTPFQVEAWTEYAIGVAILLGRIAYRTSLVGWDWQGDDYFAVAAVLFLTVRTPTPIRINRSYETNPLISHDLILG